VWASKRICGRAAGVTGALRGGVPDRAVADCVRGGGEVMQSGDFFVLSFVVVRSIGGVAVGMGLLWASLARQRVLAARAEGGKGGDYGLRCEQRGRGGWSRVRMLWLLGVWWRR